MPKRKRLKPKAPPAPQPEFWYIYRVNRAKTIFRQRAQAYTSELEAELGRPALKRAGGRK